MPSRTDGGFSVVELMIALSLVVVVLLSLFVTVGSTHRLARESDETALAKNGVRQMAEQVRSLTFEAASGYDGFDFDIPGLRARPGDSDALPGEILVSSVSLELLEITIRAEWRNSDGDRSLELPMRMARR